MNSIVYKHVINFETILFELMSVFLNVQVRVDCIFEGLDHRIRKLCHNISFEILSISIREPTNNISNIPAINNDAKIISFKLNSIHIDFMSFLIIFIVDYFGTAGELWR